MYPVSLHPLHCAASRTQCRCLLAASLDACISLVRNQSNKDSSIPHPVQSVAPACVICLFGLFCFFCCGWVFFVVWFFGLVFFFGCCFVLLLVGFCFWQGFHLSVCLLAKTGLWIGKAYTHLNPCSYEGCLLLPGTWWGLSAWWCSECLAEAVLSLVRCQDLSPSLDARLV